MLLSFYLIFFIFYEKTYFHLSSLAVFMPSVFCCLLLVYGFVVLFSVLIPTCLLCETSSVRNSLKCAVLGLAGEG